MSAKAHKGEVAFVVGKKTYVLQYTYDAICQLEETTGKTLIELASEMQDIKTLRMTRVREIFHAGLIEHHPDITVKQAGELILAAGGAIAVMGKFNEALIAAFPKAEDGDGTRPPKAPRPARQK